MRATPSSLLGQTYCAALDVGFALTFRFQFVLCKDRRDLPGFTARPFAGRFLHTHEALPVTEITDCDGVFLGLVLGYAIDGNTTLSDHHRLKIASEDIDLISKTENWIKKLGGRFLVLLDLPASSHRKIYPDPAGALGLVYDPLSGIIASTLLLCLERDIVPSTEARPDNELLSNKGLDKLLPDFDPETPVGGYGFGATPDRHVRRLLANRALDIDTLTEHRFWVPNPNLPSLSVDAAAEQIVATLRQQMQALCTLGPGYLALSGGHDSRMLLACAPDLSETEIELYCYATNWIGTLDVRVAEVLAETVKRPFFGQIADAGPKGTFMTNRAVARRNRQRFAIGSGLAHLGDAWWQRGYARQLRPDTFWLRGNFLEIITARVWPRLALTPSDEALHALTNTRIALGDEADIARKLSKLDEWRSSFPMDADRHLHDLTYLDLTLAPSQGAFYGFSRHTYLPPANHRSVFETAMQVPWEIRKHGLLYDAIIKQANPELFSLPLVGMVTYRARQLGVPARAYLEAQIAQIRES